MLAHAWKRLISLVDIPYHPAVLHPVPALDSRALVGYAEGDFAVVDIVVPLLEVYDSARIGNTSYVSAPLTLPLIRMS